MIHVAHVGCERYVTKQLLERERERRGIKPD